MPQTITIRSVADGFDDGDIPFKITFPTATGATEYDNMFKQIKDYIKLLKGSSDPKNQKIINNILGVIKLYNRHHPNKRVDLTQVLNQ
jgi:hypothetical protein